MGLTSARKQINSYLLSFWGTYILTLSSASYNMVTGDIAYNFVILANCVFSSQGFVIMWIYFRLERIGKKGFTLKVGEVDCEKDKRTDSISCHNLTVSDIRRNSTIAERATKE